MLQTTSTLVYFKTAPFSSLPHRKHEAIFHRYLFTLRTLLSPGGKPQNVSPPHDWVPLDLLTLSLDYCEPPAIHQIQVFVKFRLSCPSAVSCVGSTLSLFQEDISPCVHLSVLSDFEKFVLCAHLSFVFKELLAFQSVPLFTFVKTIATSISLYVKPETRVLFLLNELLLP